MNMPRYLILIIQFDSF